MAKANPSVDDGRPQPGARPVLPVCMFLVGVAALGGIIGWFVGWGQSESALSSIIPAILSVVGGAAGGILLRSQTPASWLSVGGLTMLVFSLGIFFGSVVGSNVRAEVAVRNFNIGHEDSRQRYFQDLQICTEAEVRLNDTREQLALERYTKAEVCPMLGIWPSDLAP